MLLYLQPKGFRLQGDMSRPEITIHSKAIGLILLFAILYNNGNIIKTPVSRDGRDLVPHAIQITPEDYRL